MPSLELNGVSAFYGHLQALWNISLKVDSGSLVSLIGSNGAGKSTTLKTVMGLVRQKSGEITFEGKRIDGLSTDRIVELGISYVPEGRRLFPEFTVKENLEMGSYPRHARSYRESEFSEVFSLFPLLKERSRQKAGTLSGGEAQMVAVGRALMSRPKLLMLDEPSAGLSPLMVTRIFEAINRIRERGLTTIIVEQDVGRALSMSARGYLLENGHLAQEGVGREMLEDPYIKRAYLGL